VVNLKVLAESEGVLGFKYIVTLFLRSCVAAHAWFQQCHWSSSCQLLTQNAALIYRDCNSGVTVVCMMSLSCMMCSSVTCA